MDINNLKSCITHDEATIRSFMRDPEYADYYLQNVIADGDPDEISEVQAWFDEAKARSLNKQLTMKEFKQKFFEEGVAQSFSMAQKNGKLFLRNGKWLSKRSTIFIFLHTVNYCRHIARATKVAACLLAEVLANLCIDCDFFHFLLVLCYYKLSFLLNSPSHMDPLWERSRKKRCKFTTNFLDTQKSKLLFAPNESKTKRMQLIYVRNTIVTINLKILCRTFLRRQKAVQVPYELNIHC